jgi:RimJ/RimL family protein N-acetyltransferase
MITEESFLDFTCPYCGGEVSFPQENAGHLRECPSCSEALLVPATSGGAGAKPPLPVATPRLKLRRFQPGDWKDLMECSDELDEDRVLAWLERDSHVRLTSPDQTFCLGIELATEEKLIGYTTLKFEDAERLQANLGISFTVKYQRRGFGAEALDALLGFCFKDLHLHRVTASCTNREVAACRLAEHVGLRREGEFVKNRRVDGDWVNTIYFAALEEEYETSDSPHPEEKP